MISGLKIQQTYKQTKQTSDTNESEAFDDSIVDE